MRRSSFRHLLAVATLVGTSAPLFVVSANSAHAQTAQLDEVEVTGKSAEEVSTEYSGAYTSNRVTIGRGEQSIRRIPQSVSVITREQMDDQASQTIDEALGMMAGVTVNQFNSNSNSYAIRGFRVSTMLLDGLPYESDIGYTDTGSFDTALFDRIEVLRGPTGMLQGTGEPSGTINLVRKRAYAIPGVKLSASAGSWDTYRGELDATGALNESGTLRGRFVTVYEDSGSFVDYVENEKTVLYGTLEYDLSPDTTLSFGIMRQDGDGTPNLGLPARNDGKLLDLDRETFLGSKWDNTDETMERFFFEIERRLANGGSVHAKVNTISRYTDIKQSSAGQNWDLSGPDPVLEMFPWRSKHSMRDTSLDLYVVQPVTWFGREHEVQFGTSTQVGTNQLDWGGANVASWDQDVFNPDPNRPEPTFNMGHNPTTTTKQRSVYTQGSFSLAERTTLVLGGRMTWWQSRTNRNPDSDFDDQELTPYAGLIYDITPEISAYTSYSTIFKPQKEFELDYTPLKPRTGDQIEVGIKGEHDNGGLNWQAAVFRINDEDRAIDVVGITPAPGENPWPMVNAGKARSQGIELSIGGSPLNRFDVSAAYAYIDTEFLNGPQNGMILAPDSPEHSFSLWTRYRFSDMPTQGWRVGAGVNAQSGIYSQDGAIKTEQSGLALLSAMIGYRINAHFDVSLKGNNLTDREYYSAVSAWTRQNHYGDPRNYMLTMRYTY